MRKCNYKILATAFALSILILAQTPKGCAEGQVRFVSEFSIDAKGPCNSLSIDETSGRLYAVCANKTVVADLKKAKEIGSINDVAGAYGFAIAPTLQLAFSTYAQTSELGAFDLKKLSPLPKISTGKKPGPILVEPNRWEVYTFNQEDHSVSLFEADDSDFEGTIKLPGIPTAAVAHEKAERVYCGYSDKNEISALDTKSHTAVEHWPMAPGESATGLALDAAHKRLFVACGNKMLVMMNTQNGQVLTTLATSQKPGSILFDPASQILFSVNEDGTVSVIQAEKPEKLSATPLQSAVGASAIALDSAAHRLYVSINCAFEKNRTESSPSDLKPRFESVKIQMYTILDR